MIRNILHIILTFLKSIEIMRKNIAKMQKLCKKSCGKRFFMKNMQKSIQKVLLLASVMSVLAIQVIFASEVASETALADNERERERVTSAQMDSSESKKSDSAKYDSKAQDSSEKNAKSQDLDAKDLGKVVAKGCKDNGAKSRERYQSSAGEISRKMLESSPSGNGDIGSILRILPNVQYDITQLRSTTPGEIDPANISILGGLFFIKTTSNLMASMSIMTSLQISLAIMA